MDEFVRLGEAIKNLVQAAVEAIAAVCNCFRESIVDFAELLRILEKEQLSNRHSRQGHNLRYWQHKRIRSLTWRERKKNEDIY